MKLWSAKNRQSTLRLGGMHWRALGTSRIFCIGGKSVKQLLLTSQYHHNANLGVLGSFSALRRPFSSTYYVVPRRLASAPCCSTPHVWLSAGRPHCLAGESRVKMEAASKMSIRASSRKTRCYVFREWLLERYSPILGRGDVILDCAGGKGDLSFLLSNADEYRSVVLDPRITKNRHIVKSIQYLRDQPEEAKKREVPGLPTYQPLAGLLTKFHGKQLSDLESPQHMRILVDKDLVEAVKRYKESEGGGGFKIWEEYWGQALLKGKEATPLGYKEEEEGGTKDGSSSQKYGPITSAKDAIDTILAAKLIVGFHPDQATDYAIELAGVLGVPVAVVPCCVFPSEFSHRRMAHGSTVKYYTHLIQYIKEQYFCEVDRLNFHFSGGDAKDLVCFC